MKRNIMRNLVLVAVVAVLVTAWAPVSQAEFYQGKTINVIIGFGPGGIDRMARLYMPYVSKYTPGNPNIVVQQMPGAGGIKSLNYLKQKARPDGLTVSLNPFLIAGQLSQSPGMRFVYQDFTLLGGLTGSGGVHFVRTDVVPGGIKDPKDLLKVKGLKYAGRSPTQAYDLLGTLGLDILGVEYRYVQGYWNVPKMKVALQQNEMQVASMEGGSYVTMFKELTDSGVFVPLWAERTRTMDGKFEISEELGPNVLPFEDLYKKVHGKAPSGIMYEARKHFLKSNEAGSLLFLGPPDMNPEAAKLLSEGFRKAAQDPDLIAAAMKARGRVQAYVSPEAGKKAIDALDKTDPKIVQFWKDRFKKMMGDRKRGR